MYEFANKNSDICGANGGALMWLGMTDESEEGNWKNNGSEVNIHFSKIAANSISKSYALKPK